MSVPPTPSADKNWITARWARLEESMARSLTVISLLLQSTTHCRYRVYTKFLLTYTAIYRGNRKVLPLGITALQPPSHFHLGTPYILPNSFWVHLYLPLFSHFRMRYIIMISLDHAAKDVWNERFVVGPSFIPILLFTIGYLYSINICCHLLYLFWHCVIARSKVAHRIMLLDIQGEHKVFPWLQIFITRKLRGIQTYFFFQNMTWH